MENFLCGTVRWIRDMFMGMKRRRTRPDLLDLPPELQFTIFKEVGEASFGDLSRCKSLCSTVRDLVENPIFLQNLDLIYMQRPSMGVGVRNFYDRCLQLQNPSALFLRGIYVFFKQNREEEGLALIQLAAKKHYPLALYTYAILGKVYQIDDLVISNLSRDFIREMRNKVDAGPNVNWFQRTPLPLYWTQKVAMVMTEDDIHRCRCSTTNAWEYPWTEAVKIGAMCDSCFWTVQKIWFSRNFPSKVFDWPEGIDVEENIVVRRSSNGIKIVFFLLSVCFACYMYVRF